MDRREMRKIKKPFCFKKKTKPKTAKQYNFFPIFRPSKSIKQNSCYIKESTTLARKQESKRYKNKMNKIGTTANRKSINRMLAKMCEKCGKCVNDE